MVPVALLGALATAGLTGCVNESRADATEEEITGVVTEYFALLEAGQAEAAGKLDTFDPADSACPLLFTDEVYATVADRPTNLEITSVSVTTGATFASLREEWSWLLPDDKAMDAMADVDVTLDVAGRSGVPGTVRLFRTGETWLIEKGTRHTTDHLTVAGPATAPGEVAFQGVCTTPLADHSSAVVAYPGTWTVVVHPGTWTVSYADPDGIGLANDWTTHSDGPLSVARAERHQDRSSASIQVDTDAAALAHVREAIAERLDECVDSLLTSPSCPENLTELVSHYPGPVQRVELHGYPDVRIDHYLGSAWQLGTDLSELTWVDGDGVERETRVSYVGHVAIHDGSVVLTPLPR